MVSAINRLQSGRIDPRHLPTAAISLLTMPSETDLVSRKKWELKKIETGIFLAPICEQILASPKLPK